MAEKTLIEWADSTFNPVWGCQKVSPACDFCYAEALDNRTGGGHWGPDAPRRRTSEKNWTLPLKWNDKADDFYKKNGRKRRVFCASMSDVFDNKWEDEWRHDLWALIRKCSNMNWLLLTKRPQNIEKMKPDFWDEVKGHVWLGATVENQSAANLNIPHLLKHDSAVRFLSCEPLLGEIDLLNIKPKKWPLGFQFNPFIQSYVNDDIKNHLLDWVIAGGESGGKATSRPSNIEWFRLLRDVCKAHNVPFLFKQWGNWDKNGNYCWDKKKLGRCLDMAIHDGFPK